MENQTFVGSVSKFESPVSAREPDHKDGVMGSLAALGFGMAGRSVQTAAAVARTLTAESHKLANAVVAFGEQTTQSLARTAYGLSESFLAMATDAVDRFEHAALMVLGQAQRTSDRAAEFAAQASQVAVGSRGLNAAPAATSANA